MYNSVPALNIPGVLRQRDSGRNVPVRVLPHVGAAPFVQPEFRRLAERAFRLDRLRADRADSADADAPGRDRRVQDEEQEPDEAGDRDGRSK